MKLYWSEGFNQSYILLRHLVERRQAIEALDNTMPVEEFCTSFVNRGTKIWSTLAANYLCEEEDFAEDFIADEDVENERDFERPVFERPDSNFEDQLVQHLRKKRQSGNQSSESSSEEITDDKDELSEESSEDIEQKSQYDDSDGGGSESSNYQWAAKKRYVKRKPPLKSTKNKRKRPRLNRHHKVHSKSDSDDDIFENDGKVSSLRKNFPIKNAKDAQKKESRENDNASDNEILASSQNNHKKYHFRSDEDV